jgi:glycosyltransferase involved in cell wall biosynthesis
MIMQSAATSNPINGTSKRPVVDAAVEVSIVMPCLNERETLASCIRKAQKALDEQHIAREIIVADNGSTDGSAELAAGLGARVVSVTEKGYGSALQAGIAAARGRYVVMGDSDDSYDFSAIEPFVDQLRRGADLVVGNRFQGGILPGAMPWKHRWLGNPVLSWIGRLFFRCPVGDFHCGLRGFRKDAYERMQLQTTGMEFASEMVIKATLLRMNITEVPTVLHPDGRSRPPHLRSWRDGWRHLRFMLLYSPRWLFLFPGGILFLLGLVSSLVLLAGPLHVGTVVFDIVTLLVAAFVCLLGYQLVVFAVFTKIFAVTEGLHSPGTNLNRPWLRALNLEIGLVAGFSLVLLGIGVLGCALWSWGEASFGTLDPGQVMRLAIPAVVLLMLGVQTIFASFFLSILTLRRKSLPRE